METALWVSGSQRERPQQNPSCAGENTGPWAPRSPRSSSLWTLHVNITAGTPMCLEAELLEGKASLPPQLGAASCSKRGEGCSEVGDALQCSSRYHLQVCFQQVLSLPKEVETTQTVWLSG